LLVPMLFLWKRSDFWMQLFGYGPATLFFGACFVVLSTPGQWPPVQALLTFRPLQAFGRFSYSIYVFHCAVIAALMHWGFDPTLMPTVLGSLLPAYILFYAVTVVMSFGIGWVCWHGCEKHLLSLRRFFPYRLPPQLAPATAPLSAQAASAEEPGPTAVRLGRA
jgi:peptidoglycan/LPS O-acetylase OafA/YrhL